MLSFLLNKNVLKKNFVIVIYFKFKSYRYFRNGSASKTGIDDIREILEAAKYHPSTAKFKVFIIDEVHVYPNKHLMLY